MGKISKRVEALLLVTLLLAVGCTSNPGATSTGKTAVRAELSCKDVEGLPPLLAPGTALLLGEMHGTAESPEFTENAVCLALKAGTSVTVGLEIPREEEARLETFLQSQGTEQDRQAFLAGPFWQDPYQDGRRSQSRFALLDQIRRLRLQGWPVHVVLFDRNEQPTGSGQERDRWMAEEMKEGIEAHPKDLFIALAGNVHTRIQPGTPWNPKYEPAGFVLTQLAPTLKVTALDVAYSGGSAWFCMSAEPESCKVRPLRGAGDDQGVRVIQYPEGKDGHSGVYNVGPLTASLPATQAADSPSGQ